MRNLQRLAGILLSSLLVFSILAPVEANEEQEPAYAKWGRIAMKETKAAYPDAAIIDYLYVGRKPKNGSVTETFKLWLRERSGHEFGVYTVIELNEETEEIRKITFEETDR